MTSAIKAPKFDTIAVKMTGTAPYIQNRFSAKAIEMMKAKQLSGTQSRKGKAREPKDFNACFLGSLHVSTEGWYGIPAPSIRSAMISACRLVGFKMTLAKLSVFTKADGFDQVDSTPLIRITKGEPRPVEHYVRLATGVADIACRGMWEPGWEAVAQITFDAEQFTGIDVVNLMLRAGMQVGIGAGRPDSRESHGQGWGTFSVDLLD